MLRVDASVGYSTTLCSLKQEFSGGCIYGVVGRNGSGKSTVLRTLAGELYPLDGQVLLDGVKTYSIKSIGKIIYVDSPVFYPDMSIGEHIKLLEKTRKISFSETIKTWDLSELLDLSPSRLSSGQQQRFSLATQLSGGEPQVLLLDEPERHLDDFWIERLCTILESKASEGLIVILASHSKRVLDLCSKKVHLSSMLRKI